MPDFAGIPKLESDWETAPTLCVGIDQDIALGTRLDEEIAPESFILLSNGLSYTHFGRAIGLGSPGSGEVVFMPIVPSREERIREVEAELQPEIIIEEIDPSVGASFLWTKFMSDYVHERIHRTEWSQLDVVSADIVVEDIGMLSFVLDPDYEPIISQDEAETLDLMSFLDMPFTDEERREMRDELLEVSLAIQRAAPDPMSPTDSGAMVDLHHPVTIAEKYAETTSAVVQKIRRGLPLEDSVGYRGLA